MAVRSDGKEISVQELSDTPPLMLNQGKLNELIAQRTEIENEIETYSTMLKSYNIGMYDPLVDSSEYPRHDLPIYDIRTTRGNLRRLFYDHKEIEKKITDIMEKIHSGMSVEREISRPPTLRNESYRKIAVLKDIMPGSPAEYAGLKNDDSVVEFGDIYCDNFTGLDDLRSFVAKNLDNYFKVIVEREGRLVRVNVKPKNWSGKGTFGCIFMPV